MRFLLRRPWSGLVAVIAVALIGFLAWHARESGGTASVEKETSASVGETRPLLRLSAEDARRAGLVIKPLQPAPAADAVELFGTVEVNKDKLARVVSPVAGRLAKINVNLGDTVGAGATLALIDSSESGVARAAYLQAQTEVALAASNLERIRGLVAGGSMARKEELKARADHEKARAALNATAAKLKALGLEPGAGGTGTLTVAAPFAGSIVEKTAVLGEHTQAYQPLFSTGDLSSLWIQADIYERDLGRVAGGATATVSVAAFPGKSFTGKVTYVSSALDRETRTAKARIEVANPEGALKPGMFATVDVATSAPEPVLQVPETALVLLQGQMTAFVSDRGGFVPRPVETGPRRGGQIVVTSGLEPGDAVVVAGAYALKARLLKSQIGDVD
jgi:cobalt-zinc-cadmium efflux system membrane fusion protein